MWLCNVAGRPRESPLYNTNEVQNVTQECSKLSKRHGWRSAICESKVEVTDTRTLERSESLRSFAAQCFGATEYMVRPVEKREPVYRGGEVEKSTVPTTLYQVVADSKLGSRRKILAEPLAKDPEGFEGPPFVRVGGDEGLRSDRY